MRLQSNKITIIGGGTAGHISTLFLAKNFSDKEITWIFPEENNAIGVGEATVPYVTDFLNDLGISIETIIKEANGNIKLGIKFVDFFDEIRYHPFGNSLNESNLLMEFMKRDKVPENILEYGDIASQFNITDLYNFMYKTIAKTNVKIVRREFIELDLIGLVVDCTGFNRYVLNYETPTKVLKPKEIQNNVALVHRQEEKCIEPYSTFFALDNGWFWKTPTQKETSYGFVFDKTKLSIEEADTAFKKALVDKDLLKEDFKTRLIPMTCGYNDNNYKLFENYSVTGIGLSSFFIEPLESTGLYFVCYGLNLLKQLINSEITEVEYTNTFTNEFESVSDFISAHFIASTNKKHQHYKEFNIKKSISDIFSERSWDYILDQNMSKSKINSKNLKYLKNLKDLDETIFSELT